jgi:hypothetical protein
MFRNMGTLDRLIRALFIAPVALVAAFIVGPLTLGGIALVTLAGLMLLTAAVGFCPLYVPFGIRTCPAKS